MWSWWRTSESPRHYPTPTRQVIVRLFVARERVRLSLYWAVVENPAVDFEPELETVLVSTSLCFVLPFAPKCLLTHSFQLFLAASFSLLQPNGRQFRFQ